MPNLLTDEAHQRMSKSVRFTEAFKRQSMGGQMQLPARPMQEFVVVRITADLTGGFYEAIEIFWDNDKRWIDDEDQSRDFDCPTIIMERNQRENIRIGSIVKIVYSGEFDNSESFQQFTSKWWFEWNGEENDFVGRIIWESDGSRKLLIEGGTVQVGREVVDVDGIQLGLENNVVTCDGESASADIIGEGSDGVDPSEEGCFGFERFWVEIKLRYECANCPDFWVYEINPTVQRGTECERWEVTEECAEFT